MAAENNMVQLLTGHFDTAADEWSRIAEELRLALKLPDDVLLIDRPASKFILTWMRDLRAFQAQFGSMFGRKKQPPLADDFTAAVALCLEQFLSARGQPGRVRSEEPTHKKRGATRPDISVLIDGGSLVATVECKTNLGWNRKGWRENCESRCDDLLRLFPDCIPYMCVLTEKNWDSAEFLNSELNGTRWFCLSKFMPRAIDDPADAIRNPIEPMFLSILELLRRDFDPLVASTTMNETTDRRIEISNG